MSFLEQLCWRAARASGAAPIYFQPSASFLDGGLISNNPTMDILAEIHDYNMALRIHGRESEIRPIGCVVSLGTGRIPVTPVANISVYKPGGISDLVSLYRGANSLVGLIIDQVETLLIWDNHSTLFWFLFCLNFFLCFVGTFL